MTSNANGSDELFKLRIAKGSEKFSLKHPSGHRVSCRASKHPSRTTILLRGDSSSKITAVCKRYPVRPTNQPILFLVEFLRMTAKHASRIKLSDATGEMYIIRMNRNRFIVAFDINGQCNVYLVQYRKYVVERFTSLLYDFLLRDITVDRIHKNRRRFYI